MDALNKIHGIRLGLDELKLCYSLSKGTYGYSLSARNDARSLVLALPDSHKGPDEDVIIVISDIEPNQINEPVPRRSSCDTLNPVKRFSHPESS